MTEHLTVADTARRLRTTLESVYRMLYAGRLAGKKIDGKWRIPAEAVQARLKQRGQ